MSSASYTNIYAPTTGVTVGQQLIGGNYAYAPGTFTNLTANTTLTPSQVIGGNVYFNTGVNGGTLTLPSAAAIYAACNSKINVKFTFTVFGAYTFTLTGANWTMYGASVTGGSSSASAITSQGSSSVSLQVNCSHTFTCIVNGPNDVRAPFSS